MKRFFSLLTGFAVALALMTAVPAVPAVPAVAEEIEEIPRISKEEMRDLIGRTGVVLIDVRYDKNWKKSDMKITGAVREHPNEIGSWAGKYEKDTRIILYCD